MLLCRSVWFFGLFFYLRYQKKKKKKNEKEKKKVKKTTTVNRYLNPILKQPQSSSINTDYNLGIVRNMMMKIL